MKSVQRWVLSSALWMYPSLLWIALLPEVFKSTRKVQYVRQATTGSGDTEQKVFEVKGCVTGCGILCNLVVLRKCSKMGTFFSSLDVSWSALNQSPAESVQKYPKSVVCETSCNGKWRYGTKSVRS